MTSSEGFVYFFGFTVRIWRFISADVYYILYILLVAVFACTFLLNKLQASTNSFQFVLRLVQNFLLMIRSLSQLSHLERL